MPRQETVEYVHLELTTHDIVLVEGASSESFVDDDSRRLFHNAHEYAASTRMRGAFRHSFVRRG